MIKIIYGLYSIRCSLTLFFLNFSLDVYENPQLPLLFFLCYMNNHGFSNLSFVWLVFLSPSVYWCSSPFLLPWKFQLTDLASSKGKSSVSFNIFIIWVLLIWCTSVLLIIGIYQSNMKIFLSLYFFSVIQIMGHPFLCWDVSQPSLDNLHNHKTQWNVETQDSKNQLKHQESAAQSLLCKQKNLNPLASL